MCRVYVETFREISTLSGPLLMCVFMYACMYMYACVCANVGMYACTCM